MGRTRDVIIVGAGPAGTAVAARLHQRGVHDVLILDRQRFPRDKPCGGGLTGRAQEALAALDLRLAVPHVPSHSARLRFDAFDRSVPLARPVNVVRRADFDASLVDQVRARGVEVRTGAKVEALAVGPGEVSLRLDSHEELNARVVIGADGVASVVRRHLRGGAKMRPHCLVMQEIPARETINAMRYDFTPMLAGLRGYLWIFPVSGGRANVGLMHYPSTPQSGSNLRRMLSAGLAQQGIELPPRGARSWPVWGFDPRAPMSAPRLLTVGDAAGVDALTGEGIAVALDQAQVAGDAVAQALSRGRFGFEGYRRTLQRTIVGRELRLDGWLAQKLYQRGTGWRYWLRLMLLDRDLLHWYAARVAGTEILADHKLRLWRALFREWLTWPERSWPRGALPGALAHEDRGVR
jgi:geranylgeranyl reductase family protein